MAIALFVWIKEDNLWQSQSIREVAV